MVAANEWAQAKNILCVRLDSLGDVLMTTPALRALKGSRPDRRLTLLTSSAGGPVAALIPEIEQVLVYDAPWLKATDPRTNSQPELAIAAQLRQAGFEAAVIFTVYSQNPLPTAMLCYLADIPLRLAYCRENPYQLLTHWLPDPEPDHCLRHEVRRQLDLVAAAGCQTADERLSLRLPAEAHGQVRSLLREVGVNLEQPWLVIHPGASAPSRRYPAEHFAEVARRLQVEQGYQILFTGTGAEADLIDLIRTEMTGPAYSLANRLDLGQFAALLALSPLLISNNTGPVHLAAAVGTPMVDLYALTNPQHTPWAVPHRLLFHDVPCKYCYKSVCPEGHHNCLRLVSPQMVVQAVSSLLAETAQAKPGRNPQESPVKYIGAS
ncbi:MAG TPA: lipopolysaccharide heptosyltransferase II [Anaerolineae bacterium]|nr:lipopolysaccharide heptosyltransferase II [Anaerolineae bacterium]HMR66194.1 lipopolysaccharide heptosyltransferase II [Anaerolineae bacterium]